MKSIFAACVLALAVTAKAQNTCDDLNQQVQQLTAQIDTTQQQAAACAAGGAIQPYNANWAPYPVHSWPDAGTNQCKQMQAHANYIQQENTNQITQIQAQEAQIGCA